MPGLVVYRPIQPRGEFKNGTALASHGQTNFTLPCFTVVRSCIFNPASHHRAQQEVDPRLNDMRLPVLYRPSGEEGKMVGE